MFALIVGQRIQKIRMAYINPQMKDKVRTRDDVRVTTIDNLLDGREDPNTKLYPDMTALCAAVYPKKDYPFPENWKDISEKISEDGKTLDNALERVGQRTKYGFKVHVYHRKDNPLLAIVFRGTIFCSWRSWMANFHWLFRMLPFRDHYDETAEVVPQIVGWCKANHSGVPIVSAGHSLGGGLAQFANYMSEDIKCTFAINASPVTGWSDIPKKVREENVRGSKIYRLFEKGEVLEFIRPIAEFWYFINPSPNENPRYVEHRVNLGGGGAVIEHSIKTMAKVLRRLSDMANRN